VKPQERDLIILIGGPERVRKAVEALLFVPPLRVQAVTTPPDPARTRSEPLLYVIGQCEALGRPGALLSWLDRLAGVDGAPAALMLPRLGQNWCAATAHPQFCGLLPCDPDLEIEDMERVLHAARRVSVRRWGQRVSRQGRFHFSLPTSEAADVERVWLLVETVLSGLLGPHPELPRVGMAFSEALTNAVEHGNLELGSGLKDEEPDGMLRFFEERAQRLLDPRYRRRRVQVSVALRGRRLRIRVRNEGASFDFASLHPRETRPAGASPYGLGLAMIKSLVDSVGISEEGRCLTLTHHLHRSLPAEEQDGEERDRAAA
jgi:anti-sigma regulatory factor (Ser/Thr protein kinase)